MRLSSLQEQVLRAINGEINLDWDWWVGDCISELSYFSLVTRTFPPHLTEKGELWLKQRNAELTENH